MHSAVKKLWLDALRSGEYIQGENRLALRIKPTDTAPEHTEYCCLGVLCQIAVECGVMEAHAHERAGAADWISYGNGYEESYLPDEVVAWAELPTGNPTTIISDEKGSATLSELNDNFNYDFKRIADIIESQL